MTPLQKAHLAKLAYEPKRAVIEDTLDKMFGCGNVEFIWVDRTDTEGFAFRRCNDCIIVFAGTNSLRDLWRDLCFLPMPYYSGYIHSGFGTVKDQIRSPVRNAVENLFFTDLGRLESFVMIGHSLGASTALLAADILYESFDPDIPMQITTFGCPNGWSRGARKGFVKRHPDITHYVNHGDYVTWLMGVVSGRPGEDKKLSGAWGHRMDKYVSNITQIQRSYLSLKN